MSQLGDSKLSNIKLRYTCTLCSYRDENKFSINADVVCTKCYGIYINLASGTKLIKNDTHCGYFVRASYRDNLNRDTVTWRIYQLPKLITFAEISESSIDVNSDKALLFNNNNDKELIALRVYYLE